MFHKLLRNFYFSPKPPLRVNKLRQHIELLSESSTNP